MDSLKDIVAYLMKSQNLSADFRKDLGVIYIKWLDENTDNPLIKSNLKQFLHAFDYIQDFCKRIGKFNEGCDAETYRLLMKRLLDFLFSIVTNIKEKSRIISSVNNWLNQNHQANIEEIQLTHDFEMIVSMLKKIEKLINKGKINVEKVRSVVDSLRNFKSAYHIDYVERFITYIKITCSSLTYINKNINEIDQYISSISIKLNFSRTYELVIKCNQLFPSYFNKEFGTINVKEHNMILAKSLIVEYRELINTATLERSTSKVDSRKIPVEACCAYFLADFLNSYDVLYDELLLYFGKSNYSFLSMLTSLLRFAPAIQFAIFDILWVAKAYKVPIVDYLKKISSTDFCVNELDSTWKNDFKKALLRNPYREVLQKFHNSENDLESDLAKILDNTFILPLPKFLTGITIRGREIYIKNFSGSNSIKGSTFYVLLHELGHCLQKMNCQTVEKCSLRKSNGGRILEDLSFGKYYERIRFAGQEYLFNADEDIGVFQTEFALKNSLIIDNDIGLYVKGGDPGCLIQGCGFSLRN